MCQPYALASDGTVYVGCTDGFVYGVQRSGVIKWKYPAGGPVVGLYTS
jgi:outer membrane protein assembly factor BamB